MRGATCLTRCAPRALRRSPVTARRAAGRSPMALSGPRSTRSTSCIARTDSTTVPEVVGIVVVSHSEALAEGVIALAREMGGDELSLQAAGGMEEPGVLGTDAERVRAAIERAMSGDGVLVLMDLGSALISAEFALEMVGEGAGPVRLREAPLVEGAVAAAVAARGGATLDEVAAEARGALAMKTAPLGAARRPPAARRAGPPRPHPP